MSGGWRSRQGPIVFAAVAITVVVAVAVSYGTRGHSTPFSQRPVAPHMPAVAAGSATMAALRQVADGSCVAKSTVRDIETHKCYEVVGTPIARADDVQMARVDDDESCWCIDLTLNDSAAARLDRLIRTAPATEVMAIRFGSTAIAFPRPPGPLGGTMSINGENWTQVDAQRVVDALSGPKTAHDYPGITIPPNLLLPPTSSTVPPGP